MKKEPEKWAKNYALRAQKDRPMGVGGIKARIPNTWIKGSQSLRLELGPLRLFLCTWELDWGISKHKQRREKPCAWELGLSSCWEPCGHRPMDKPELASWRTRHLEDRPQPSNSSQLSRLRPR